MFTNILELIPKSFFLYLNISEIEVFATIVPPKLIFLNFFSNSWHNSHSSIHDILDLIEKPLIVVVDKTVKWQEILFINKEIKWRGT